MEFSRMIITTYKTLLHHFPQFSNARKTLTPILSPTIESIVMVWTCSKCTFINPDSLVPKSCQICLSPFPAASSSPSSPPPLSSSSNPRWPCKACTFLNDYKNSSCEICGKIRVAFSSSDLSLEDDELDSSVGNVFLPLQRCKRTIKEDPVEVDLGGSAGTALEKKPSIPSDETRAEKEPAKLKILSYNVWFREDMEMYMRMKAIGELILLHSPDVICLQEVTPDIYGIFRQSNWWKSYKCSLSAETADTRGYYCMLLSRLPVKSFSRKPFYNSAMGRELCVAEVTTQVDIPLVVATSHLESPCPAPPKWDQMYSKERVEQANEAVNFLKKNPNVIFCGDMNWDDKLDGQFPLPDMWTDAWMKLRPGEDGWTYDTKSNLMLSGNWKLQKRLDRFLCKFSDFKITGIDMIGMEAIPGLSYVKQKKGRKDLELPVLPSDHYGLLLTITAE